MCVLKTAKNGQIVVVNGKVMDAPHDMLFDVGGCQFAVVLTYAGYKDSDVGIEHLRRDRNLKRFQKYTSSVYKVADNKMNCTPCAKYGDVEATVTGEVEIATIPPGSTKDNLGFLRNTSGKVVGKWGWGHPVPFAAYRLVIFSVSDATARKLPKPRAEN